MSWGGGEHETFDENLFLLSVLSKVKESWEADPGEVDCDSARTDESILVKSSFDQLLVIFSKHFHNLNPNAYSIRLVRFSKDIQSI